MKHSAGTAATHSYPLNSPFPHRLTVSTQDYTRSTSTGRRPYKLTSEQPSVNDRCKLEETQPSLLVPQKGWFWRLLPRIHQGLSNLLKCTPLLAFFSSLFHISIPLTMLSRITSQITHLCLNPCHRICFWGTQAKKSTNIEATWYQQGKADPWGHLYSGVVNIHSK